MHRMMCIIDQARGQEIWILAIGHCIFMDRDDVKVKKNAKKNKGDIQHPNQRTLVNKGFVMWPKSGLFLARPTQEILRRQDRPILSARVTNQNTGFASSCQADLATEQERQMTTAREN